MDWHEPAGQTQRDGHAGSQHGQPAQLQLRRRPASRRTQTVGGGGRVPPPASQRPVSNVRSRQLPAAAPRPQRRLHWQDALGLHAGKPRDAGPAAAVGFLRTPGVQPPPAHSQLSAAGAPVRSWQPPSSARSAASPGLGGSAAASREAQWARQPAIPADGHAA